MAEAIRSEVWPFFSTWLTFCFRLCAPVFSLVLFIVALVVPARELSLGISVLASIVLVMWGKNFLIASANRAQQGDNLATLTSLYEFDLLPTLICEDDGNVVWQNQKAMLLPIAAQGNKTSITNVLAEYLPNAPVSVRRLTEQVSQNDTYSEQFVGLEGPVELFIQKFGKFRIWRIASRSTSKHQNRHDTAMLTVGRNGTILFMSQSAKTLIGMRQKSTQKLFPSGPPISGLVQDLQTEMGKLKVRVDIQPLTADRSHIFLTPDIDAERRDVFALKDLPIPMLLLKLDGKIDQANTAALTLLGYSKLDGLCLTDVFDSNGVLIGEWVEKATIARSSIDAEFLRVRGAKKETFVQVALKRIDVGDEVSLVAILTDATKLKSLEAQFVQSQKMQAIGQLAGGVAHDFNNLLTAISGHCDLLLLRHDAGDLDYADLMQIHQNANRAAGLVSQLLAFSRKQTLQLEHLDLRNTLSDLTHLLNRLVGETVTLTLTHDPVLKPIRADKRQLEQVIMNLVVNARDAMSGSGEISIQTENISLNMPMKRDRVTVPVGDYIAVRVQDAGIGIDEEALQKIFEPFYTTKRVGEGTGLGLSTAYGIVKQTGGFIFADSKMGQGTCFSLLFPASDQEECTKAKTTLNLPVLAKEPCSGVVLLVEDEAPVRAFASRALSMRGFTVIEAESAESALEILEDPILQVDVFVTDVVMPGMDGPTWVQKALEQRPNVKVVFVSGYAEGAFQGKMPKLATSVFLPKPFSLTDLTATVQDQLDT